MLEFQYSILTFSSGGKLKILKRFNFKEKQRGLPRFVDQVGHQTMYECIGKHFFTKSCHCQTYQNYEQSPQRLQKLYFQSHFSASKINGIFLNFFSVKNIRPGDQLL
jgi:hypothetical protein